MTARRRSAVPLRIVWVVVFGALALHLLAAANLHLTEDEAYYRLWARAPAFGYYDHPPMIAWWIAAGRWLAGDTPLGVRLLPCLACALTSFLIFDLARASGLDRRSAGWAAIAYNLMPLVLLGGELAVPDSAASLFWAATLAAVLRAHRAASGRRALLWWAAAGAAAGLAALSKYSALFLGPGILLWLLWRRENRAALSTPGPWLALEIAIGLFGLNIAWNVAHHWLTFVKQFGRIAPTAFAPADLPLFLASQFLLLNPALTMFAARARRAAAPFLLTSAPFVFYLLVHSLHAKVEAHWPAPIYASAAILAAIGIGASGERRAPERWRWPAAFACLAGLGAAVALLAPWRPVGGLAGPLRDWPGFAGRIEQARRAHGAGWVGAMSYGLAAELADEPAIQAPIFQLTERQRYAELNLAEPGFSRPGLVIDLPRRLNPALLGACFSSIIALPAFERGVIGEGGKRYAAVLVAGPRADIARRGCR